MINKIQSKLLEVQVSDDNSHKAMRYIIAGMALALVAVSAGNMSTMDVPHLPI